MHIAPVRLQYVAQSPSNSESDSVSTWDKARCHCWFSTFPSYYWFDLWVRNLSDSSGLVKKLVTFDQIKISSSA